MAEINKTPQFEDAADTFLGLTKIKLVGLVASVSLALTLASSVGFVYVIGQNAQRIADVNRANLNTCTRQAQDRAFISDDREAIRSIAVIALAGVPKGSPLAVALLHAAALPSVPAVSCK
jgi:hypothetical protein